MKKLEQKRIEPSITKEIDLENDTVSDRPEHTHFTSEGILLFLLFSLFYRFSKAKSH